VTFCYTLLFFDRGSPIVAVAQRTVPYGSALGSRSVLPVPDFFPYAGICPRDVLRYHCSRCCFNYIFKLLVDLNSIGLRRTHLLLMRSLPRNPIPYLRSIAFFRFFFLTTPLSGLN